MKKEKATKKLTLSPETLRWLTTEQPKAKAVHGAGAEFNTYYCTGDSVRVCCAD